MPSYVATGLAWPGLDENRTARQQDSKPSWSQLYAIFAVDVGERHVNSKGNGQSRFVDPQRSKCQSPFFGPRPEHDFERPGRPMLLMKLKIGFRDMDGVGHVVVDGCSRQPV
jgi:hypothetical protein